MYIYNAKKKKSVESDETKVYDLYDIRTREDTDNSVVLGPNFIHHIILF